MPDPGKSAEEAACIILPHRNLQDCLQAKQIPYEGCYDYGSAKHGESYYVTHGVSAATAAISSGTGAVKASRSPVMGWRKVSFQACRA